MLFRIFKSLSMLFQPIFSDTPTAVAQLALHSRYTPPLLPLLALFALARSSSSQRLRFTMAWAALTLPFVSKVYPQADLLRLQAPALLPWLWMAGTTLESLQERRRWAGPLFVLGLLPYWWHPQMDWIHQVESRWLAKVVPTLPEEIGRAHV